MKIEGKKQSENVLDCRIPGTPYFHEVLEKLRQGCGAHLTTEDVSRALAYSKRDKQPASYLDITEGYLKASLPVNRKATPPRYFSPKPSFRL